MRTIGVTGGVGSGKSVVLDYLRDRYGARLIVADDVARQLEEPGAACYNELLELLGREVLGSDGYFDNKKFAAAIFSDENKLAAVNAIVHPEVRKYILSEMEKEEKRGCRYFVAEAALLIEEHYDEVLDELWYIFVPENIRRERLKSSRGYSDEKIDSIFEAQLSEREFREHCIYVIDNGSSLTETYRQIDELMDKD
ncbi:MAG: dephospho-CoA kinase [Lachnospiraceae bacterium]|nr:dephospho-CoA kinase [Lachnospiraceae bacterium]